MNSMRLTERQVQALYYAVSERTCDPKNRILELNDFDYLEGHEMTDLEARLYVASHPETVDHIVEMEVE